MIASATTRRGMIGSMASGAVAAASAAIVEAGAQTVPKTFVLIHGAWHGGWCWRRVSDLLEKGGHKVFSPTLTGLGERSHLLTKDVNLDTHIADIVNVVKWEDLRDVCLVVHSYGGWPGSGALEHIGDRVSSIVWLDAFKPENGQRGADYTSEAFRKALFAAVEKGEPGRPAPKAEAFFVNEKDRAWVDSKLTLSRPARLCSRSSSPAHARRWRRRPISALQDIRSRPSTRPWRNARPTRRGGPSRRRTAAMT
jgi:pimeloyl-ACP methyl ester carboxylesterase